MSQTLVSVLLAFAFILCCVIAFCIIVVLKNKMSDQTREEMLKWVDIAVAAAQQMYHLAKGSDRKSYVLDFLAKLGYNKDSEMLNSAIEAAVLKLHQLLDEDK